MYFTAGDPYVSHNFDVVLNLIILLSRFFFSPYCGTLEQIMLGNFSSFRADTFHFFGDLLNKIPRTEHK